MAITPTIRSSQAVTMAASESGSPLRMSLAGTLAAINFPTDFIRSSQGVVMSAMSSSPDMQVSQAVVMAAVRGAVANPTVRAWTFSLDGHEFYVLRLGDTTCLIFDVYSQQWYEWETGEDGRVWRANTGANWLGAGDFAATFGSNVVVGDDTFGVLWYLDPTLMVDQSPFNGGDDASFKRIAMGQVPVRRRDVIPCFEVYLTADTGNPAFEGAFVTLELSDDAGRTFYDQGQIVSVIDDYRQEFAWRSLGQIEAPGRLFRVTQNGAFTRLDGLDMADPFPGGGNGG